MPNILKIIAWPIVLPAKLLTKREPKPKRKSTMPTPADNKSLQAWLSELKSVGITKAEYDRAQKDLTKQFGHPAAPADVAWRLYNESAVAAGKRSDWQQAGIIYFAMAQQVQRENKDSRHLLQEAARCTLRGFQASGVVTQVKIFTANDKEVCPACRKQNGKLLTIKDALRTLPVPNHCQNPHGCRCSYSPVIK